MKQSKIDSLMESLTNTAIGFIVSLVTMLTLVRLYDLPLSFDTSAVMVAWFTVVSVARQYVLRRLFDGKSVWRAIRGN